MRRASASRRSRKFYSELALDRDMYDALAAIDVSGADAGYAAVSRAHAARLPARRRRQAARGPRAAQADRRGADQARPAVLEERSPRTCASIEVARRRAARGAAQDFIAAHPPDADGMIRITTDYPDYNPFMTYAVDDELRKQLYVAFRSRGDQANEGVLREILKLRAEKAGLLGFTDWADYITADKMIKTGGTRRRVHRQGVEARGAARRGGLQGAAAAAAHGRSGGEGGRRLAEDRGSRTSSRCERYEVDASVVRQYFPYERVLAGLLEITTEIFELAYVPVAGDAETWHAERAGLRRDARGTRSSAGSTSTCIRATASTSTRRSSRSRTACAACSSPRACSSATSRPSPGRRPRRR